MAFIVGEALSSAGLTAVLSGGGAATIYSAADYQSNDLDFILDFRTSAEAAAGVMVTLGFRSENRLWRSDRTPITVEFPAGPLAIGDRILTSWVELEDLGRTLQIISPTDCVCDRLSAFYQWNDWSSLEQALAVTRRAKVDLDQVEQWSKEEGALTKYAVFRSRLV